MTIVVCDKAAECCLWRKLEGIPESLDCPYSRPHLEYSLDDHDYSGKSCYRKEREKMACPKSAECSMIWALEGLGECYHQGVHSIGPGGSSCSDRSIFAHCIDIDGHCVPVKEGEC